MRFIVNPMPDGTCRTIKHTYSFTAIVNTTKSGTYGATMIAEKKPDGTPQNEKAKIYKVENGEVCFIGKNKKRVTYIMSLPDGIYRIRKLSPIECFRLMGFDRKDYFKAKSVRISETHLYNAVGNSIAVNVLEAIFTELGKTYEEFRGVST